VDPRPGDAGRVVIADDHEAVRDAVRDLLTCSGVAVVGVAADGGEAVELAEEFSPDVVVLDLQMPGLGGIEAMTRIRDRDPDVQMVVFSAEDDPATTRLAVNAGASELLVKGSATGALCEAVARAVAARRRRAGPGPVAP
jgi:two-component system invasion response regulator UvrY